jgi:hypothetical protein
MARNHSVDSKVVSPLVPREKLAAVVTSGGHRRIPLAAVLVLLREMGFDDEAAIAAVRGVR